MLAWDMWSHASQATSECGLMYCLVGVHTCTCTSCLLVIRSFWAHVGAKWEQGHCNSSI